MAEFSQLFPHASAKSNPRLIAGPCSAETRELLLECAGLLSDAGVKVFRAGLWKPRTHPGTFEGVGAKGIPWLRVVRKRSGMSVITEVASARHVRSVVKGGVDGVWIGARTVANPFAVQEIADAIKESGADISVLVKNPVSPDLDLWIGAFERLLRNGITRLGAVHRGFSRYGEHKYRNSPIWAIPIELKRRFPGLPLYHDPSHCGGKRELIADLAQNALSLGFDGLMIESHPCPDAALSDGGQQITPSELKTLVSHLDFNSARDVADEQLIGLRSEIDSLDSELIGLLARRMEICDRIGRMKKDSGMRVIQEERYSRLLSERVEEGASRNLSREFMRDIFSNVHSESVRRQLDIISGAAQPAREEADD